MNDARRFPGRWPVTDLVLSALILLLAYVSPNFIPYNMDEFSHYHVLGCWNAPLSAQYDRFALACGQYDLKLPGTSTYLPLRSYLYIGVAQTVPFLAFWSFFDDPVAGRVQGAAYLILATWLLSHLVQVSWRRALFAVLLFPAFCAPFILDTGPVGISLCSLLLVMLLLRRGLTSDAMRTKVSAGLLIGLIAFVAVSIKPVFVWAMPALVFWALWLVRPQAGDGWLSALRRQLPLIGYASAAFVLPLAFLFMSLDRSGHHYYEVTSNSAASLSPSSLLFQTYRLAKPVWNSTMFDFRTMTLPGQRIVEAVPLMIALCIVAVGLVRARREARGMILLLLVSAAMTFAIITTNANAWAPHHLAYAMIFVAAAIAACLNSLSLPRVLLPLLIALSGLYWVSLAVRLPHATIQTDTNFDKDRLVRFLRTSDLDKSTVQVHVDWGTYYLSHTFGDSKQLAVTVYEFSHQPQEKRHRDLAEIRSIASKLQRDVLLITRTTGNLKNDPVVVDVLGLPKETYPFDSWMITRYGTG